MDTPLDEVEKIEQLEHIAIFGFDGNCYIIITTFV